MEQNQFLEAVEDIFLEDSRFDREAYLFIRTSLDFTLQKVRKAEKIEGRHLTAQELLEGFRTFSMAQFGPMTKLVLNHWGIYTTEDVGSVVFNLIKANVFGKTQQDDIKDFENGFDFDEAFVHPYLPPSKLKAA